MRMIQAVRLLLCLWTTCLTSCGAWTISPQGGSTSTRGWVMKLSSTDGNVELPVTSFTTKTNKQIVFDDQRGRFFETSLEPTAVASFDPVTAFATVDFSSLSYERETNLPFANDNEMVPTELLFGKRVDSIDSESAGKFPHFKEVTDILLSDAELQQQKEQQQKQEQQQAPCIVQECYAAWNKRDFAAVVDCFAPDLEYQDSQYLGTIDSKAALQQHFQNQANLLPPNSQLVLEQIAVDPSNGNIGTQFHVTTDRGARVPLTRGCSFYQTDPTTGRIVRGFRASEMFLKPSPQSSNLLVSSASRFLTRRPQTVSNAAIPTSTDATESSSSFNKSIIDEYFDAWNRRDMQAALDCFTDDCTYQTEDPVFVDTFQGKKALRRHLEKNAATLPSSCRIILDHTAMDPNGKIGIQWHLEVNGIALPNLRGCSMYTTIDNGRLLQSGLDVTEAPVKLPRQILSSPLSLLPARALFRPQ